MTRTAASGALAVRGGAPALPGAPATHLPVSDTLLERLRRLIEHEPLSTLFGEGEVRAFEERFAARSGARHAVAVNSGTSALHTALTVAGIGPGDDVAVTCFSFIATASVILQLGARPVFVDIDPVTLAIDPQDLAARVTERTKAVIAAHLFGIPADLVALRAVCRARGLLLIEDACQALGASVDGKPVGGVGDIGCFSFNVKKIIQTGEGGMLITDNADFAEAAREVRVNGLSIFGVERLGFNYTLTNIQACLGLDQLAALDDILARRRRYAQRIRAAIRPFVKVYEERRPGVVDSPYAVAFALPTCADRDFVVEALACEGVPVSGVYSILYHHEAVFGAYTGLPCPVAERVIPVLLSINPSHLYAEADVVRIAEGARKVLADVAGLASNVA